MIWKRGDGEERVGIFVVPFTGIDEVGVFQDPPGVEDDPELSSGGEGKVGDTAEDKFPVNESSSVTDIRAGLINGAKNGKAGVEGNVGEWGMIDYINKDEV